MNRNNIIAEIQEKDLEQLQAIQKRKDFMKYLKITAIFMY